MTAQQFSIAAFALLLVACPGCGSGGRSSSSGGQVGLSEVDQAQIILADAQVATSATSIGVSAALSQIDPVGFPPAFPALISMTSGSPAGGTVTLDFGNGTLFNNALYQDVFSLDYSSSNGGANALVGVIPSGLNPGTTVSTAFNGDSFVDGSLSVTLAINNNLATGNSAGMLFFTANQNSSSVTPDSNFTLTYAGATSTVTFDGTLIIDNGALGVWNADLTNVTATLTSPRVISSGTITLTRANTPNTATFMFDSPNAGDLTITPLGIFQRFQL